MSHSIFILIRLKEGVTEIVVVALNLATFFLYFTYSNQSKNTNIHLLYTHTTKYGIKKEKKNFLFSDFFDLPKFFFFYGTAYNTQTLPKVIQIGIKKNLIRI